ncbi:hypothetical protein FRB96_001148 [Tulasnella sp. 330]|nr:hypothetical protein FRB96_001148 [Tulasnella sp. 330]KAG8875201.1 hypothetical protein FRB97_005338 [Tulasnella sp. 331]KAG8880113.1 hypothetical protein FRB98_005337 [Tulasnella sp. 332]
MSADNQAGATVATPPSPERPGMQSRASSYTGLNLGFFSTPYQKFIKESDMSEWAGDFTLLDTLETYFDSRMDLLERRLKKQGEILKYRANEQLARIKTPAGDRAKDIEAEVKKFKLKVSKRMTSLTTAWQSAKVIRTREKVSFFVGVMSILLTTIVWCLAPEWLHIIYTVQTIYFLPTRWYAFKKKAWHYFLFDLCYYVNVLCLLYIWVFPKSSFLWRACYLLTHGSLASAVITWRNSLVFHDSEKVVSLYIHIYPPLVFTVIRHFYPDNLVRFPAVAKPFHPYTSLALSAVMYIIWQGLYWKIILVDRKSKVESGERTTSFGWLLHDKRGVIGRMLQNIPPQYRILSFMTGQLVYTIITEIPALFLYDSSMASCVFLLAIFGVSVWNGAGYYIEVFGRKFERELEALRKELAETRMAITPNSGSANGINEMMPQTPNGDHILDRHFDGDAMSSGVSVSSDMDGASEIGNSPFMIPVHPVDKDLKEGFQLDVASGTPDGVESQKDK